jgi:NADPH:quinone reductase-like Zn-dependent oxidoreductase
MRALLATGIGGCDKLVHGEAGEPALDEGDLLVRVHAVGLSIADIALLEGRVPLPFGVSPPYVPGQDLAGVVVRTGAGVTLFRPGDAIVAHVGARGAGTLAELCAVPETAAAALPRGLSFEESAGVPAAALAAFGVMRDAFGIGDEARADGGTRDPARSANTPPRLLLQGLARGVGAELGPWIVRMAREAGALVTVMGDEADARAALREGLEGEDAFWACHGDLARRLNDTPVDAVLDVSGGQALMRALGTVRRGGRVATVAHGPGLALPAGSSPLSRARAWWQARPVRVEARRRGVTLTAVAPRPDGATLASIVEGLDTGLYTARTDKVFEFKDAAAAFRYLAAGRAEGKVVVRMPVRWRGR